MQSRVLLIIPVIIGVFSYILFGLGLLGAINYFSISILSVLFLFIILLALFKNSKSVLSVYTQFKKNPQLSLILVAFILVNFIGVLGPELGFDALWYHLTLPKIYLETGTISFIPGGILYYSLMPKLIDLLYIPALFFGGEILAKFIHFLFGILTVIVTFKIANLFVNKKLSYLAAIIFYSNLIVGWMSITSYIDLGRTFITSVSIYFFLLYFIKKETKYLYASAVGFGLEIASKFLGFATLFSVLLTFFVFWQNSNIINKFKKFTSLLLIPLLIVSPWLIFSFINSNNPFYPFFTSTYNFDISLNAFNPLLILKNIISLLLFAPDPISPVYFLTIPFLLVYFKQMSSELKILLFLVIINLLIWNFVPQKNARFILPYLPLFSVISVWVIGRISDYKIKSIFYVFIYLTFLINITYRGVANFKYIPYIFGFETKEDFLKQHLNFEFGDYIDINGRVREITNGERVLIYGIHNLYYVDFPFDHESWVSYDKQKYKYILSRGEFTLYSSYNLIYKDNLTNTYLYERNQ